MNPITDYFNNYLINVKKDTRVMGVFQFNEANITRSLDNYLIVVMYDGSKVRQRKYVDQIPFSILGIPFNKLLSTIHARQNAELIRTVAYGEIPYLIDDIIYDIRNYARKVLESDINWKPEYFNLFEAESLETNLHEIEEATRQGDLLNANYLMDWLFHRILANFFSWRGLVYPSYQDLLSELNRIDKNFYERIIVYLDEEDFSMRFSQIKYIAASLVKPFGGYPRGNWEEVLVT